MSDGFSIDQKKLKRMMSRIILLEKQNVKTKSCSDTEMITKIQKIIEEEVKCF